MAQKTTEQMIAFLMNMVASNVLESEQADGKRVKFGNIQEIKDRITFLRDEAANPVGAARQTRTTFASFGNRA